VFTAKRLFDLSNESEMGFTVKLKMDSIIKQPLNQELNTVEDDSV